MTDMFCAYPGNRDEMIVAYLYDDAASPERMVFEAHVSACEVCRLELADLRGVRGRLAEWRPPTYSRQASVVSRPSWWRDVPAWAQAAAAVLVLGVAAGAANINVHHDASGFSIRTGWAAPAPTAAAPIAAASAAAAPADGGQAPWRADLAKLESDMRSELKASSPRTVSAAMVAPAAAPAGASMSDDEVLRKVKALIEQSEKKEQNELALHIAQLARDTHAERIADLTTFEHNMRLLQNNTGYEVAKQQMMIQTLATHVSQTVPSR